MGIGIAGSPNYRITESFDTVIGNLNKHLRESGIISDQGVK